MIREPFLHRKIKLIQEDLNQLKPLARFSFHQIASDPMKYNVVERLLEKMITRAIDINRHLIGELGTGGEVVRTYEDTFLRLADLGVYPKKFAKLIAPSAGLRNVLVHEYDEVDERKVYTSMKESLTQYHRYCAYLLQFIAREKTHAKVV